LVFAATLMAAAPESTIQQAIRAEGKGEFKRAYLLWAQAAAKNPELWARAKKLESYAGAGAGGGVTTGAGALPDEGGDDGFDDLDTVNVTGSITDRDLQEAQRFAEPRRLKPFVGRRSFHLRGDAKTLYEKVAREFGYVPVIDRDLQNAPPTQIRFDVDNAKYDDALHLLEAATNTFIVPVSESVLLAAIDSQQKRNELEPSAAAVFQIPQRSSVQEAQEILQAVQQSLEIRRAVLDPGKRLILMRGPYSRVQIAGAILQQLMGYKAQVEVEIELITFAESKSRSWGLGLATSSTLVNFGQSLSNILWSNSSTITTFLGFGGGATFLGLGFTGANLFGNATHNEAQSLMKSQITVVDGQAANFHIGDKYPIVTSQFSGVSGLGALPTFNFEDLGLIMKVTPAIHSSEEVTLDVEAEFKALGTSSLINGIPSITDRKLQSKVRLNTSEWAVVAGLVSRNDALTISGIAGLSQLPVIGPAFRNTTKSSDFSEALILIKAHVLSDPPSERVTRPFWVGSDTRWRTVL
jgi:hypothetical protein